MKFSMIIILLCVCFFTRAGAQFVSADTSIISVELLSTHLNVLANDSLKGRGNYTKELHVAADYIASQFRQLQLKALAPLNSYYQPFTEKKNNRRISKLDTLSEVDYQHVLKNVIGVLPGTKNLRRLLFFLHIMTISEVPALHLKAFIMAPMIMHLE